MQSCLHIARILTFAAVLGVVLPAMADDKPAEMAPKKPDHSVAVIYFHRTERCPTCKAIGGYVKEATKAKFAEQMKRGQVDCYEVDFQNAKNKGHKEAYKITGPTLVLANVNKGKVTEWKPMPEVWSLVFKKEEFFKYVQGGIGGYLESK